MRISDLSSDVCSSDLLMHSPDPVAQGAFADLHAFPSIDLRLPIQGKMVLVLRGHDVRKQRRTRIAAGNGRTEEHTSELQSLMRTSYAVFCLNKKNRCKRHHDTQNYHRSETPNK